ncbi:archease [Zeaxanthinibacter sp. PT1]|uniref:archease n=1 Tax=Zeaxanthinibacter TaxID=561554 RepID=UPI00234B63BE|nr:archease [Zeaxanthinibacter sp. PT1]MDC6351328.1 archease [Zeaxanthinibacter sp. PT1]
MKIKYLPHTADIRMKIEGSSFKEILAAGVLGMANILKDGACNSKGIMNLKVEVAIEAADKTCLMIDLLSDVLSHSYTSKGIFCEIYFNELSDNNAIAVVQGYRTNGFDEEIKAVTYHEAQVVMNKDNRWETIIIFDI